MLGVRNTELTKTLSSYSCPTFIKIYFSEMLLDVALKSLCFENTELNTEQGFLQIFHFQGSRAFSSLLLRCGLHRVGSFQRIGIIKKKIKKKLCSADT